MGTEAKQIEEKALRFLLKAIKEWYEREGKHGTDYADIGRNTGKSEEA